LVKAIVSHGEVRPLEPLPSDWQEGQSLRVEKAKGEVSVEEIDRDFAVLAALCEASDPADEELERALQEARRQAKVQVRRYGARPGAPAGGSSDEPGQRKTTRRRGKKDRPAG
jgi:hypothetical protein